MQFTLNDPPTHTPLFSLGEKPPPRMHGHMEIFLPHRTNVHQIYGRDFFLSGICCHYVHLNSSKAILMCVHSKPRTLIFLKFFLHLVHWLGFFFQTGTLHPCQTQNAECLPELLPLQSTENSKWKKTSCKYKTVQDCCLGEFQRTKAIHSQKCIFHIYL